MVQYTFESAQKSFPEVLSALAAYPRLKKYILYNLLAMIGQWYNKDVNDGLIFSKRNKRSESVRTIEELSLEFGPQTSKHYF